MARLVLTAFVGPPPTDKHEAAHWDGNPDNNKLSNLRWATGTENNLDKHRHGTMNVPTGSGVKHPRAKYTDSDIALVLALCDDGYNYKEIAEATGVARHTVAKICTGKQWVDY